jgi:hypothetical protein
MQQRPWTNQEAPVPQLLLLLLLAAPTRFDHVAASPHTNSLSG